MQYRRPGRRAAKNGTGSISARTKDPVSVTGAVIKKTAG